MRRQKCAQCGTMLDVSKLENGSKFACASCGAVLVVGEATAVKKSLKESGPAFTPKGKSEAAAPAPAPARRRPAGEEGAAPSRRSAAPSEKKSKLPLVIGAGVVVVLGVVLAIVFSGKGGPGGGKGESPVDWWASKNVAMASEAELRRWIDEARQRGYDRDDAFWKPKQQQIDEALLKQAPSDVRANERLGNKDLREYADFDKLWEQIKTTKNLPPEMEEFFDALAPVVMEPPSTKKPPEEPRMRAGKLWVNPARYVEISGKLDEFVAWKKKAEENPAADATLKFTGQALSALSSSARKMGFAAVAEGPFVLILGYEDNADAEKTRGQLLADGKKWAAALKVLRDEFEKRIREPLGLPAPEAGKYFCAAVVPTADDLKKLIGKGQGLDANLASVGVGEIPGFFSAATKWAQLRAPVEPPDKALFGGDLAHVAAHQLQWQFSNDPKVKLLNYMEEWNGIWLTEGLAEYLGGGIDLDPASGKASFSGKPPRRIEFLRALRDNGAPLIPVRELVQLRHDNYGNYIVGTWYQGIRDGEDLPEAAATWLGSQQPVLADKMLYAQSWLLVHFLYEGADGKYRAQLLDLVMTALRGGVKPERYRKGGGERFGSADEAFCEILGLRDEAAWKDFQAAYDAHLRKVRGE